MRASSLKNRMRTSARIWAARLKSGLLQLGVVLGADSLLMAEEYPAPMVTPAGHVMVEPGSIRQVSNFQPVPNGGNSVIVPNQNAGVATFENIVGQRLAAPFGPRGGFTTQLDDSMGAPGNLYTVFGFLPYFVNSGDSLFFVNLDGSVTERGDGLFNVGAGFREYDPVHDRILTLEGHVIADEGHSQTYWAAGFALQSLGKYTDHQLTANFVMGDKEKQVASAITGSAFQGNNIVLTRTFTNEHAYSIVEYMWGGRVPFLGEYGTSAYVGGYYTWNEEAREALGVKVRGDVQITEDISAGFTYTNDKVFGREAYAQITMTLPDGKPQKLFRPNQVYDRLGERIIHNHRIASERQNTTSEILAINPLDGLPYVIAFVDPNAAVGTGNGTFESPFSQLAQFTNNSGIDIIYINPNSAGGSSDLDLPGGLTLFNNQRVLGGGAAHTITAVQGVFQTPLDPAYSGILPTITNSTIGAPGANNFVIQLANNNEIANIAVDAANTTDGLNGIGIVGTGISNFNIHDTSISRYTTGVSLTNATGTGVFDNNTLTGTPTISQDGFNLNNTGGTLALSLQNNTSTLNGAATSGAGFRIDVAGAGIVNANNPNGTPSTGIIGNTANNNGTGLAVSASAGSQLNLVIDNNNFNNNQDSASGFHATADAALIDLVNFSGNTIEGNNGAGIYLEAMNGGSFRSMSEDLNGNNTLEIALSEDVNGDGLLAPSEDLNSNGLLDPGEDANGNGVLDLGEDLNGNGMLDLALNEDLNGNGQLDLGIAGNTLATNMDAGIVVVADSGMHFLQIGGPDAANGNSFNFNNGGGIRFDLSGTAIMTTNIENNIYFVSASSGAALRNGFNANTLAANDDGSTGQVPVGFDLNFFGQNFSNLFVNNNGNVTFNSALASFTPFPLLTTATPILAPFFADVDTRSGSEVTYGNGLVDGRSAFGVNWVDVGHFVATAGGNRNSFQLVLVDRSDIQTGDFDIEFNYDEIVWEAGEASGSDANGLGGDSARVGYTNGVDTAFELPGSAVNGAFLDNGPADTSLTRNSINSTVLGRYVFEARGGTVSVSTAEDSHGIAINTSGDARLLQSRIVSNQIVDNRGAGVAVVAAGNSMLEPLIIRDNVLSNNRNDGFFIQTNDSAIVRDVILRSNQVNDNGGYGIRTLATNGSLTATIGGPIGKEDLDNDGLLDALEDINQNGVLDLYDTNIVSNASDAGVFVSTDTTALGTVLIQNNDISGTANNLTTPIGGGAGIFVGREGTSLLTATVLNNRSTGNEGSGMRALAVGNSPSASQQPMSGTPNSVTFADNLFDGNMEHGAALEMFADASLIGNGSRNTVTNNGLNGLLVHTNQASTFGDPDGALPPGIPSVLDANTITGNSGDGLALIADSTSQIVLNLTNTQSGTETLISGNGGNGISFNTTGGRSDIQIGSGMGSTVIDGNGTANGGNGIVLNATAGTSTFRVDGIEIRNNLNGLSGTDGDGIQFVATGTASTVLNIGTSTLGNTIQGNAGDGISIIASGDSTTGTARPLVNIVGNTIGGLNGPLDGSNGEHGVRIELTGGTPAAGTTDATESGPVLTALFEENEISRNDARGVSIVMTGAAGIRDRENGTNPASAIFDPVRFTFLNNNISSNAADGIFYEADPGFVQNREVLLFNGPDMFFPNNDRAPDPLPDGTQANYAPTLAQFTSLNVGTVGSSSAYVAPYINLRTEQNSFLTVTGNTIQNNGDPGGTGEGIYLRVGTNSYVAADIQSNTMGGNLDSDFRTESFTSGPNPLDFVDRGPFDPMNPTDPATAFDSVFLDDSAQLDLRFNQNTGNQINVSARGNSTGNAGAAYTNDDQAKGFPNSNTVNTFNPLAPTTTERFTHIFQVDDGPGLDAANNIFINAAGVQQIIADEFNTNRYNLRAMPDPQFPSIFFAPAQP